MVRILLLFTFIGGLMSCGTKTLEQNKIDKSKAKLEIMDDEIIENMDEMEVATFANGCFWCTEAVFQSLKGVKSVKPGYTGGFIKNPAYREVKTGSTGHAEAVEIIFDPKEIGYKTLLEVFFETHNPTTLNRQGNDVGTQYRSEIFYHDTTQKQLAELALKAAEQSGTWEDSIVTKLSKFDVFYEAEDYHQNYYDRVGDENTYCTFVITPKLEKFKTKFGELLKDK